MFSLVDKTEDLSPGHSLSNSSERLLQRGKGGDRIERSFLQQRPGSRYFKRLLSIKENQISQVKEFSIFGLPWWHSGWESACQCRGHGFEPWSGRIPHAAEQLGPWATTTGPAHLEPVLCNKRDHDSERPAHRDEEWAPLATTRESPLTETKTQHSQK